MEFGCCFLQEDLEPKSQGDIVTSEPHQSSLEGCLAMETSHLWDFSVLFLRSHGVSALRWSSIWCFRGGEEARQRGRLLTNHVASIKICQWPYGDKTHGLTWEQNAFRGIQSSYAETLRSLRVDGAIAVPLHGWNQCPRLPAMYGTA